MKFESYQSPYSWRYGSQEMRQIWSEQNKKLLWRKIWLHLADVQSEFGLVTKDQVEDLRKSVEKLNFDRAAELEKELHHDLMAEIKTFAEQCKIGGGIIHLGATSTDIKDNAEALRLKASLRLILEKLKTLLTGFAEQIKIYADTPVIALTHIQPAEPTTLGYRLSQTAQDLLSAWEKLSNLEIELKGKGFKGAVGTSASFGDLIGLENLDEFEKRMSAKLNLEFYRITTQTYPRQQEYTIISALAGMGAAMYKFAFDLRILQSPAIGELAEPFGKSQVGSSAMPFKRNPITSEKINSLGRALAQLPRVAWDNAAHSLLERTLDDSANRRSILPEAFLISDEMLISTTNIITGLVVNKENIEANLEIYGSFAATERLLMALVKKGADRQEMHETIRNHSLAAWEAIKSEGINPLIDLLQNDPIMLSYLSVEEVIDRMNSMDYLGIAPTRAREFADLILEKLN